jgi:quinol monooxygenase YgiN
MQTPAAILTIRLSVRDELRRELGALLDQVATQPGCQRTALGIDATRTDLVTLVEEWGTRDELERHLRSDEFWRLLLLCELSTREPEFCIDTVSAREGLDAVARSRAAGATPRDSSPQYHQGR